MNKSPTKHRIEIDLDLLNLVDPEDEGEGWTSSEIAEKLGCGNNKARKIIRQALETGKCRTSKRYINTIRGYKQRYTTYVFNKGGK